jgi:hypothetical protein
VDARSPGSQPQQSGNQARTRRCKLEFS